MKFSEIDRLIESNPLLAGHLTSYSAANLEQITLFSPDSTGPLVEKYHAFCDKLTLESRPYLMVLSDELAKKDRLLGEEKCNGYYDAPRDTVVISQSSFDAFNNHQIGEEYTVAHEVGHAQYALNRRSVLEGVGAIAISFATGIATAAGTKRFADTVGITRREKGELLDTLPVIAGVYSAWAASKKFDAILNRREELIADDHAAKIIGKRKLIDELVMETEDFIKDEHGEEDLIKLRQLFDQEIKKTTAGKAAPSEERLQEAYAIFLGNQMKSTINLKNIWNNNLYPFSVDRLRHQTR